MTSPGIALYTVFAGLAGYSGYLLWDTFLGLDSYQFPLRSFGDMGFRVYGPWMRHLFNILQSIQLLLNVGLIVISNGEALSQAAKFKLCYIICCLVWALAGFLLGQVRTLQKFGWLANVAVWLNLTCMFITMGGAAHSPPNYAGASQAAGATIGDGSSVVAVNGVFPPVMTSGGLPSTGAFYGTVSGAMQAVFAYGGSMIFPEFMAEMMSSPYAVPGVSDGGAHTKFFTGGAYSTDFLTWLVRDEGVITLEEAHYRLSNLAAQAAGFQDRGVLREGAAADVLVYDLEELAIDPPWIGDVEFDLPGGEWRRVQRAKGYHQIIVNGEVTFEDGDCTGATPGHLLRRGRG